MKLKANLKILLLVTLVKFCASEDGEFFTVTGSQLLKLNKSYRASVNYQGYKNETVLEISILKSGKVEDTKQVKLLGTGGQVISLKPFERPSKSVTYSDYVLKVKSISGTNFESSRELQINKKDYSVFIQTDKSLYKPSDKIHFRVLLLDESTRPYQATKVQIYVTDGADNRLKQFDRAKFVKGVHQNELQLSDSPVLGKWKIHVKVDDDKEVSKEFEVAEYTLPKFEFSIDANPDSNYKEGKISVTARAKYTFGKIAKGNATIRASSERNSVSKTVEVNGKKNVEFTHEELGIQKAFYEQTINLFATFTEELSGKDQNATAKVQIHVTPHKIRFIKSGDKFKPGLPYKITALLNYHDKNAPVTDKLNPVKFTTKIYSLVEKKCKRFKSRSNFEETPCDSGWGPCPTYSSPLYRPPANNGPLLPDAVPTPYRQSPIHGVALLPVPVTTPSFRPSGIGPLLPDRTPTPSRNSPNYGAALLPDRAPTPNSHLPNYGGALLPNRDPTPSYRIPSYSSPSYQIPAHSYPIFLNNNNGYGPGGFTAYDKFESRGFTGGFSSNPTNNNGFETFSGFRATRNAINNAIEYYRAKEMEEYDCKEQSTYEDIQEIYSKNGKAEVTLDIPSNATRLDVEARYFDTVESVKNIAKAESESKQYIQAKVLTEKLSIETPVKIEIMSTHPIQKLNLQIFTNGENVISKTFDAQGAKKFEIELQPRPIMAPKSRIIFFYLTSNGEIISDKVKLKFEKELPNEIDIQLSANQAQPGNDVNIEVSTNPGSFVGLLGVDQSVLVLKKGNDIAKQEVLDELEKYNKVRERNERETYIDFKKSGILLITNAKKEYQERSSETSSWRNNPMFRSGIWYTAASNAVPLSASFGGSRLAASQSFQPSNRPGSLDIDFRSVPDEFDAVDRSSSLSGSLSSSSSSKSNRHKSIVKKPIEVRKDFPETWFFETFEILANESNTKTLTKKVPDSITSWIITGFSVDPDKGLGITKEASKLNVFQPFFVTTNLPYSIKRGEVSAIPIVVFNYLESDQEVDVVLYNTDQEFEFLDPKEEENSVARMRRSNEKFRKNRILVKSNEGTALTFMIRALKVGSITIKVTAESQVAGDGLERKLLVEPEGIKIFKNEAVMIDLKDTSSFSSDIKISVPTEAVPDSTKIEAAATGDILGPSIDNLDGLIKLPSGCGEQNMINFVPNIVVLDSLTSVNQLTSEIESKAKDHLETGYQKELTYKHDDGSYSAFGESDDSGSTWLTAYVAKSFNQASKYIKIDDQKIEDALRWLAYTQNRDGSFTEVGYMLSKSMQGGAAGGESLTAYTLIAFLENKQYSEELEESINKALTYIESRLFDIDDPYAMAVTAYALQLANHAQKDVFLDKLERKAENVDGLKYWKRSSAKSSGNGANSINVETTAYALLAFIEADRDSDALPIMKWLITQRNEKGGFYSTQDTVIGLQALAKMSSKMYSTEKDIRISIETPSASPVAMNINSENSLILQKQELPSNTREFKISAVGKGVSVLQISYKYNMPLANKARFQLKPKVLEASNKEFLHLSVCTSFIEDSLGNSSNMAVMEVTLPSGFTFDFEHKLELLATEKVKRVETKDGDTIVIVYFDDIITREICPEFKAYRTHGVAKQKPAPVVIYDYYDNSRRTEAFYNAPEISLCDICGDDVVCADVCESDGIEITR